MGQFLNCFSEITRQDGFPSVGISIQWSNLHDVLPETAQMLLDIESALAPSILYFLKRRDVLGQAISHFLMMESGYAHSTETDNLHERRGLVLYNREKLQSSVNHTRDSYVSWEKLFNMSNIQPVTIYYEDFVNNPVVAFGDMAEEITGVRFSREQIMDAASGLRKISNATDDSIRRAYLADADASHL